MITFKYEWAHDALQVDGNGCVCSVQANLVGTDEEHNYSFSVTIRNCHPCALDGHGREDKDGFVPLDLIDEADCCCWMHHRIGLGPADPGFTNECCDYPQEGYRTAEEFYKAHITNMIKRDLAEFAALELMSDKERGALQAPRSAPIKSFQTPERS